MREVRKLLLHMNFEPDEKRLECLARNSEGLMKRPEKKIGDYFRDYQKHNINRIIRITDRLLQRRKQLSIKNYIR